MRSTDNGTTTPVHPFKSTRFNTPFSIVNIGLFALDSHFAYSFVTDSDTVVEVYTRVLNDELEYQPANVQPLFVGSGSVPYVPPTVYSRELHELPPLDSNETVTVCG